MFIKISTGMSAAKNQQSTEFKMPDVKPVITKRR